MAATAAELEEALQEVARRGARIEALTCEIAWYRWGQLCHALGVLAALQAHEWGAICRRSSAQPGLTAMYQEAVAEC